MTNACEFSIGTYVSSENGETFKVIVASQDIKLFENIKNKDLKISLKVNRILRPV